MASSTRSKPAAKKTASKATTKVTAKKVSKVAAKPAAAKPAKAVAKKVVAKSSAPAKVAAPAAKPAAAKPAAKPVSKVVAKTEAKVKAKVAARKSAPNPDEDDEDDEPREILSIPAASRPTANAPVLPDDLAEVAASQAPPPPELENPAIPRRKSVLEVAEEDDEFDSEPPIPTADNIDGLLDRLRKVAQFGGDALEELPRLIEQLEQIDNPAVMPRLLGLLEDNDPWGIYWNVLYVLEKFDDAYLRALLGGIEALYARAPQWTYTCVIRILNTRGDEDDCTAAFERMVQASPSRTLVVQILRELANDADTDADQKANIARTITAVGGAESSPRPSE